jgi:TonB family protein
MDAVTEILIERSQQVDKLGRVVVLSLVAHGLLVTAAAFAPRLWPPSPVDNAHVMTISLAGPEGPVQGRVPTAAKEIQQVVPDVVKPKNDAPPALKQPEMIEPVKAAKPEPKAPAKPDPKKEVIQLHGSKPTQGAEVKAGAAKVETHGAAIPFGGLGTGGGGGGARTDVGDFCCPDYIVTMQRLIKANWQEHQGQVGTNTMKFVIRRDGTITDIQVEKGANQYLDIASQRALTLTQRLPPLPAAFTPDRLTVHLDFEYKQ